MQVGDEVEGLAPVLEVHELAERTVIVADVLLPEDWMPDRMRMVRSGAP
jgi:hypothetical protein